MTNYFEFNCIDFKFLALLFGMIIYFCEVFEVFKPLEEKAMKAKAERQKKMDELHSDLDKDKFLTDFRKFKETKGESTNPEGDPKLMV